MLKIKLSRVGKKKQPTYKIIILEEAKDPKGDYLEQLGTYNPSAQGQQEELVFNEERVKYWLSQGAQPTDTVHNILVGQGLIKGKKKNVSQLGKKYKAQQTKGKEEEEKPKEETKEPVSETKEEVKPAETTPPPAPEAPETPDQEEKPKEPAVQPEEQTAPESKPEESSSGQAEAPLAEDEPEVETQTEPTQTPEEAKPSDETSEDQKEKSA